VIEVASVGFAETGFAGTSLDELARRLDVTKQTILYHFGSKEGLLTAVITQAADDLQSALAEAVDKSEPGWGRIEAIVRAAFAMALGRPELLGLLREVSRLGPPRSDAVTAVLKPLVAEALEFLEDGMETGLFRRQDPRLVLASAYAATTGVVTEPDVLRVVGLSLDLRVAARLRRTVLEFLDAALVDHR
jgi:TetR/AcrR family transcriptional regulator